MAWHRTSYIVGLRVRDLMSGESVTAGPDWPLVGAVQMMIVHGVNRLPVVDKADRPLGILTRDDVLGAVASSDQVRRSQSPTREASL